MMSIMRTLTLCCSVALAAVSFTACGGGGGPTITPAIPPQTTTLGIETILGAPGFFAPNGFVVYSLSNETTTNLQCTVANACVTTFVPLAPPTNFALTTGFTTFVRSDNHVTQLAYLNQPIYTYAFDTGPGSAAGQGLGTAGGSWNVTRP